MSKLGDKLFTPRFPAEINLELRKKFKRMNDYSKFSINGKGKKRNGSEKLAMEIQLLQRDLKGSMAFHIKLVKAVS